MMQLIFAPLWGRLSDQLGRRPLIIVGIVGFAVTQLMFGVANGLALLYAARLLGLERVRGSLARILMPRPYLKL
jgi:DHA1 family multidrug resistance protein-like MFS transporter